MPAPTSAPAPIRLELELPADYALRQRRDQVGRGAASGCAVTVPRFAAPAKP